MHTPPFPQHTHIIFTSFKENFIFQEQKRERLQTPIAELISILNVLHGIPTPLEETHVEVLKGKHQDTCKLSQSSFTTHRL